MASLGLGGVSSRARNSANGEPRDSSVQFNEAPRPDTDSQSSRSGVAPVSSSKFDFVGRLGRITRHRWESDRDIKTDPEHQVWNRFDACLMKSSLVCTKTVSLVAGPALANSGAAGLPVHRHRIWRYRNFFIVRYCLHLYHTTQPRGRGRCCLPHYLEHHSHRDLQIHACGSARRR